MNLEGIDYFDGVIAGMPKCGSTTLIQYFHQHPDIYVPWSESRDKDKKLYKDWNNIVEEVKKSERTKILRAEHLTVSEEVYNTLYNTNEDIKIIFTLRDPVKRAYSAYWHKVRNSGWKLDFKDVFDDKKAYEYCIKFGEYKKLINNLTMFEDENKFFIIAEQFWNETEVVLRELYSFLDLDYHSPEEVHRNRGGAPRSDFINDVVTGNIKIPFITENTQLLRIIRKGVNIFNLKDYPKMDEKLRKRLIEYYREKNEGLDRMIGQNLSKWWE